MKRIMEKLETLLEWSGLKKEIILLVISGISLLLSLFHIPLSFSIAWIAIILWCADYFRSHHRAGHSV